MKQLIIDQLYKRKEIVKFFIAGCTAAGVNFITLYILVDYFHIWYLLGSGMSFAVAFVVSFSLQKFWTFRNKDKDVIHKQAAMYLATTLGGLFLNLLFMYILVDFFHWWYLLAQFVISAVIAVGNFMIYKFVIFKT